MMFNQNFVTCIKTNGRILREVNGEVKIPFGSEYSILLKNLNSVRALASISVDGKDVTEGTKLILEANRNFEIERFIIGGNFDQGNKFKFIERSTAVEQHRGIGSEDGLVRVEFWKEAVQSRVPYSPVEYYPRFPYDRRRTNTQFLKRERRSAFGSRMQTYSGSSESSSSVRSFSDNPEFFAGSGDRTSFNSSCFSNTTDSGGGAAAAGAPAPEEYTANFVGITAPGGVSNQQFVHGDRFPIESTSTVIVLQLKGAVHGKQVVQPVTVSRSVSCVSCGQQNKSSSSFCSRCGTGLELVG